MATFQDLPPEVILEILDLMHLPEFESLVHVDRKLRNLAGPFFKTHRDSKLKCQSFRYVEQGGKIRLLYDVLFRPRAAYYLENLSSGSCFEQWQSLLPKSIDRATHNRYPTNMVDMVTRAVMTSDSIPHDEKYEWVHAIEIGDEGPVMALLCTLLPNLKVFEVEADVVSQRYFAACLQQSLQRQSGFFSSLEYIRVDSDIEHYTVESELHRSMKLICQLPSLRVLGFMYAGQGNGIDQARDALRNLPGQPIKLSRISLQGCTSDQQIVDSMLDCTTQLINFDYIPMASGITDVAYIDAILDSLLTHAKHSLQCLRLRGFEGQTRSHEPHHGGNLKHFTSLRTVELDASVLLGTPAMGRHSIITELPKSVQDVTLHEDPLRDSLYKDQFRGVDPYLTMLHELLKKKGISLPRLQSLRLVLLSGTFRALSQSTLNLAMRSIGVELKLERADHHMN